MHKPDRFLYAILMTIVLLLGIIALRPILDPQDKVLAQSAQFDHVTIVSAVFLHKGQQGMLVLDRRNANVWFIPKVNDQFQNPVFVLRVPFEKMDQLPH
ncbi:MAG: hypothetical protein ABI759_16420 [Candidatus Solibacter sp.]